MCHALPLLQARLDRLFASHGLDRKHEVDPVTRGEMAVGLLEDLTYVSSEKLVLTFDSYPEEEMSIADEDDLTGLGV